MAGFSSCYFCGTALDASVADQPVVPEDLAQPDGPHRTVTLCPTCSRKLDAVMDEVRAAVGDVAPDESGPDSSGADGSTDEGPSAGEFFDESPDIRDLSDADGGHGGSGGGGGDADGGADGGAEGSADTSADADRDGTGGDQETTEPHSASVSSADGGGDAHAGDDADAANDDDAAGAGEPGENADEADNQTITRLENSKVMRMLENREFPVERAPFETVAANAYEVRPQDVGKVIDMAIDRGLLAEQNGNLVRPD